MRALLVHRLGVKPSAVGADQPRMVIMLRLVLALWVCLSAMGVLMYSH